MTILRDDPVRVYAGAGRASAVYLGAARVAHTATNLATNPRSLGTAYARVGSSTSTVALGTTAPPPGFTSYTRMTGASTSWSGVVITPRIATVPGETITASALVRSTTAPGATARVYVLFYNAAGTWLAERYAGTVVGSDFARISQTMAVLSTPAGVAFFDVQIRPPDAWGTANTLDVTAVLVQKAPVLLPYFDGSTPRAEWTGTANASTSTLWSPG